MTTVGIQGITGYQLQIQSMSSKITELAKEGDSGSMSVASALKQQLSGIKSQLYTSKLSNDRIMFQNYDKTGAFTNSEEFYSFDAMV